jgi:S-adenosylmethionine decarboxylase
MTAFWGYHLILDCAGCNDSIKDRNEIYKFVKDLVQRIDMVAVGEPTIEYLLPGDANCGYSVMQLITTSNICCHFVERGNTAYFDVFSCKEFDTEVVKTTIKAYFNATSIRATFLTRQA